MTGNKNRNLVAAREKHSSRHTAPRLQLTSLEPGRQRIFIAQFYFGPESP
jgi:hypothetical protein